MKDEEIIMSVFLTISFVGMLCSCIALMFSQVTFFKLFGFFCFSCGILVLYVIFLKYFEMEEELNKLKGGKQK